jgi:hypothetical protein
MSRYSFPPDHELFRVTLLESMFPVENLSVNRLKLWPIFRLLIASRDHDIAANSLLSDHITQKSSFRAAFTYCRSLIYNVIFSFRLSTKLLNVSRLFELRKSRPSVAVFSNDFYRLSLGTHSYSKVYDALIDSGYILEDSSINLEIRYLNFSLDLKDYRPCLNLNLVNSFVSVLALLCIPLYNRQLSCAINQLYDWCGELSIRSNLPGYVSLSYHYYYITIFSFVYQSILAFFSISKVYQSCYYSDDGLALCLACSRLNIQCIDIQHGLAGSANHRAYASWLKIPEGGYPLLPSSFWTWSNEDMIAVDHITSKNSPRYPNFVSGQVFERMIAKNSSIAARLDYSGALRDLLPKCRDRFTIFVSLQFLPVPTILMNTILSFPDIIWLVKLHPMYGSSIPLSLIPLSQMRNVVLISGTTTPSVLWLSISNLHITGFSATYFDALSVSVPTVFCDHLALHYFQGYIQSGSAVYVESVSELCSYISNLLFSFQCFPIPHANCDPLD